MCVYIHIHVCVYLKAYPFVCFYTYIYMHIYTHVCVCVCVVYDLPHSPVSYSQNGSEVHKDTDMLEFHPFHQHSKEKKRPGGRRKAKNS